MYEVVRKSENMASFYFSVLFSDMINFGPLLPDKRSSQYIISYGDSQNQSQKSSC